MTNSAEGVRIQQQIVAGSSHTIIRARAGTGKSTQQEIAIRNLAPDIHPYVWATSHNRHITDRAAQRLPRECRVKGLHQAGLGMLYQHFKPSSDNYVQARKYEFILRDILPRYTKDDKSRRQWTNDLVTMFDLARNTMVDVSDTEALQCLCNAYVIDAPFSMKDASVILGELSERGIKEARFRVDYGDMLWVPVTLRMERRGRLLHSFLDEAQDCSPLQAAFFIQYAEGSRMHVIGDPRQAIYAFLGAGGNTIDEFNKYFHTLTEGCEVLPLTICYRCPTKHLDLAREIVPDIKNAPGMKPGNVERWFKGTMFTKNPPKPGWRFLSRTNRPLIEFGYTLMKNGIKMQIDGRDIGKNMNETVDRIARSNMDFQSGFLTRLQKWCSDKEKRLSEREGNEMAIASLHDRVASIECVYYAADEENIVDLRSFKEFITGMFGDEQMEVSDDNIVRLSTIHKFKGKESPMTLLLQPQTIRHPSAVTKVQRWQEENIDYIWRTRSTDTMVYVNDMPDVDMVA